MPLHKWLPLPTPTPPTSVRWFLKTSTLKLTELPLTPILIGLSAQNRQLPPQQRPLTVLLLADKCLPNNPRPHILFPPTWSTQPNRLEGQSAPFIYAMPWRQHPLFLLSLTNMLMAPLLNPDISLPITCVLWQFNLPHPLTTNRPLLLHPLPINPPAWNKPSSPFPLPAPPTMCPSPDAPTVRPLVKATVRIPIPLPPLTLTLINIRPLPVGLLSRATATLVPPNFPLLKQCPSKIPVWLIRPGATRSFPTTFSPARRLLCLDPPILRQCTLETCGCRVKATPNYTPPFLTPLVATDIPENRLRC